MVYHILIVPMILIYSAVIFDTQRVAPMKVSLLKKDLDQRKTLNLH